MSQITFKTIEKKINRKNSELKEVLEARKKLEDREKEFSAEIEKLQTQKVEIIFEQVKKVVKNEKLDITSESVNPILEILREGTIKVEEISDYHIYPIADNDSPRLSADRLEYTLSDGLVTQDAFSLESIDRIYKDLTILKNEDGEDEIGFKNLKIAEEYIERATKLWHLFSGNNENGMIMQFLTDILKKMAEEEYITEEDLYKYSEQQIVEKIRNCSNKKISKAFEIFSNSEKIERSETEVKDKYCISVKTKKRYTDPLVQINGDAIRIDIASEKGKKIIEDIKNYKDSKYACLDINF